MDPKQHLQSAKRLVEGVGGEGADRPPGPPLTGCAETRLRATSAVHK